METAATTAGATSKPTFLYDDCCPLCRGYTATFTALGWADRAPFSQVDDATMNALDFDTARHHIPLVGVAPNGTTMTTTKYGLDGILDVVATEAPLLKPVVQQRHVRAALDRFYWFITYNRRHIVTAPPPVDGIDCAPDFEPAPVTTYLGFCTVAATGLATIARVQIPVASAAVAATALVARRDTSWKVNNMQAAGHVGSTAVAAAIAGTAVKAATRTPQIATLAAITVAARKLFLRRWMLNPRTQT